MIPRCLHHPRRRALWRVAGGHLACGFCRWMGLKRRDFTKASYQKITDRPKKKALIAMLDPEIDEWIRRRAKNEFMPIGDVIEELVISAMSQEV